MVTRGKQLQWVVDSVSALESLSSRKRFAELLPQTLTGHYSLLRSYESIAYGEQRFRETAWLHLIEEPPDTSPDCRTAFCQIDRGAYTRSPALLWVNFVAPSGGCCHSSAIERRRKGPDSPWFQSWLPSPRRGYGWGSETSGARLQKRPRPRWSPAVPHRHRVPSHDGQGLP